MAKQLSLPSDITATEVRRSAVMAQSPLATAGDSRLITGHNGDDDDDTASVTSDVLPEGQDEQAGCVIA